LLPAGALGIEMMESYYAGLHAASNFQFSMLAAVEEGLEMAGMIVFINALLTYIAHHYEDVLLRFSDRKQNPSSVISINRHAAYSPEVQLAALLSFPVLLCYTNIGRAFMRLELALAPQEAFRPATSISRISHYP
jgi:hypothetical protein